MEIMFKYKRLPAACLLISALLGFNFITASADYTANPSTIAGAPGVQLNIPQQSQRNSNNAITNSKTKISNTGSTMNDYNWSGYADTAPQPFIDAKTTFT